MFWRRVGAAAATLLLLAAASWLPARAAEHQLDGTPAGEDLARPALLPPAAWPAEAATPVQAAAGFFWSLSSAVSGQAVSGQSGSGQSGSGQPAATGGRPPEATSADGGGSEAYARAYGYLSPGWRAREPFAAFLRGWRTTGRLDLLAVVPAGHVPGDPRTARVFVEVRLLQAATGGADRVCVCFAHGIYTAEPTPRGWVLTGGGLTTERFGLPAATLAGDPGGVAADAARALARHLGRPTDNPRVTVRPGGDHLATAAVELGGDHYRVALYQLADGRWVAISTER